MWLGRQAKLPSDFSPSCITWATESNKVKIKFTLEQARTAQRENNVKLYSLTSNGNINPYPANVENVVSS
jgi:hypothetical protein